jgi:hypothetical protein
LLGHQGTCMHIAATCRNPQPARATIGTVHASCCLG